VKRTTPAPATVDDYIASFPVPVQERLQAVRHAARAAAPGSAEKISYRMPAISLNGILLYYAAYRNHIGLYPGAAAVAALEKDLEAYRTSKGGIQLPLDRPVPLRLIARLVKFRLDERRQAAARRQAARRAERSVRR
jgi:uncharacterized protein YdhG (YjbR/CyaY superfamily)